MDNIMNYIQIKDCDDGAALTVDAEEAKEIIDSMLEDNTQEYTFSTVSTRSSSIS